MKKMKLLAGFLLTLILALGLTVAAYAYDYEVTVSSGSNGTVTNGSETGAQLKATVAYNGLLTIGETTGYWGKPTDARYYFYHPVSLGRDKLLQIMFTFKNHVLWNIFAVFC